MSGDAHHGHGSTDAHGGGHGDGHGAHPPALACAPMVSPMASACRCGGCAPGYIVCWPQPAKHDDKHGHHDDKPKPPKPQFSNATPKAFREGFVVLWAGIEQGRPVNGLIADAMTLIEGLVTHLESVRRETAPAKKKKPAYSFRGLISSNSAKESKLRERIERLIEAGIFLASLKPLVDQITWTYDAPQALSGLTIDREQARRLANLAWIMADQGCQHPEWASNLEPPPRWAPG